MSKINKKRSWCNCKKHSQFNLFGKVIVHLNNLESDGGLVLSDNVLSDRQYVISKGDNVTAVAVGQEVLIDIDKLMVAIRWKLSRRVSNHRCKLRLTQLRLMALHTQ
jgi:hypothetical protein